MAIKPIDMQVLVPKVNEVSRIQNDEQHRSLAVAQSKAQNSVKDAENNMRQVNSREETQKATIQEKQQRQKGQGKQKQKEKNSSEKEAEKKSTEVGSSGRTIDIRL